MFKQRILVQLSVRGDIRFVSHHDLMRVLGRAARRAGLPVAMSEGFNPRQKISLLLARGVGVASESEFAEIDLSDWTGAGEVARRLNEQLPAGLHVERATLGHPRTRRRVVGIEYHVACRTPLGITGKHAGELLDRPEVWVERKSKKSASDRGPRRVNIRPFIRRVDVHEHAVEEVWQALGLVPLTLLAEGTITRTAMELSPPA